MDLSSGSQAVVSKATLAAALPAAPAARHSELKNADSQRDNAFWLILAALVSLSTLGLSPVLMNLWDVWTNDPLRSIGMLIVLVSVILTLRAWRQRNWELDGTWWGMAPLSLAFVFGDSGQRFSLDLVAGQAAVNLLPPRLSLYFFASGVILLFAGIRVWRLAWLPLALLLFAQPVPAFSTHYLDLPLQSLSARAARSFAGRIGFPPANQELLRLMFTPSFGMFIAPGCDGLRGAVTLGYAALITGYLKGVRILRLALYVAGAVMLGYLFNLLRLCALVLYYRIALGHAFLENFAKQADYMIGGSLMLVAALLFLWAATRDEVQSKLPELPGGPLVFTGRNWRVLPWKLVIFAMVSVLFAAPGVLAIRDYRKSLAASIRDRDLPAAQLDLLMPKQLGAFRLTRAWQEEASGRVALETAAYSDGASHEIVLGVWLPPGLHSMHESWRTRGEDPERRSDESFATADGRPVSFDTAFYADGITDSFAGNALCTPATCLPMGENRGLHLVFTVNPVDFNTRGVRAVPIFFRVETPHSGATKSPQYDELLSDAKQFLANVDFPELSRRFQ
jgi:exosortase J